MSTNPNTPNTSNTTPTNFEGIHVSKGFVRGLQGQVLKLEQVQQSLIQQLEYANRLATEYHATAAAWQQKYDAALHEMNETKQSLERETLLRMNREQELEHFKNLLQEQLTFRSNSSSSSSSSHPSHPSLSPHPAHPHHHHHAREPITPVSIPSSPRPNSPSSESSRSSRTTDCSGDPICDSDTE